MGRWLSFFHMSRCVHDPLPEVLLNQCMITSYMNLHIVPDILECTQAYRYIPPPKPNKEDPSR